jgi:hypothetical protein
VNPSIMLGGMSGLSSAFFKLSVMASLKRVG